MKKVLKYYPPGYDSQAYWEHKYIQENIHKDPKEFEQQRFWGMLQRYISPGKKYLDVGCGIGGWIIFLRGKGYDVAGIDTAMETIEMLNAAVPALPVSFGSITNIPYPNESFDGVLAIGTLEYAQDSVPQALAEVSRVIKPGGIIFMEVPALNTLRRLLYLPLKRIQEYMMNHRGQTSTFSNYVFSRNTIRRELGRAGFQVLEMRPHELPGRDQHYGLYIDWFILRGAKPYTLNAAGKIVKAVCEFFSPWIASTGIVIAAQKSSSPR